MARKSAKKTTRFVVTPTTTLPPTALPARPIANSVGTTGASSRFKGVGTLAPIVPAGLRRNEFQDTVLALNETERWHYSDDELAVIFDNEFPQGGVRIADRPELVQVIRKFYNAGTHGKQQGGVAPEVQSLQYEKPKSRKAPVAEAVAKAEVATA